jgi:cytidylate kinase
MMIATPFASAVVCRQRRVAAAIAAPGSVRRIQRTQKPVQSAHSKINARDASAARRFSDGYKWLVGGEPTFPIAHP